MLSPRSRFFCCCLCCYLGHNHHCSAQMTNQSLQLHGHPESSRAYPHSEKSRGASATLRRRKSISGHVPGTCLKVSVPTFQCETPTSAEPFPTSDSSNHLRPVPLAPPMVLVATPFPRKRANIWLFVQQKIFPWGKWASQLGGNGKMRWLSKQLEQLQRLMEDIVVGNAPEPQD